MSINERGRFSIDYETRQSKQAENKKCSPTAYLKNQLSKSWLLSGLKLVIQDVIYYKKIDLKLFVMRNSS